jgi:ribosome-binding factor A
MPTHRSERVSGEVADVLAELLRQGLRDPRVTPITLTSVKVSPDLGVAHVNFIPLGGEGQPAEILAGLRSATGFLRRELGHRLRLRHVPELRFHLDDKLDKAFQVTRLLDELSGQRTAADGEAAPGALPDGSSPDGDLPLGDDPDGRWTEGEE